MDIGQVKDIGDHGPLAHLVERFHGMEEVKGSIPLRSTRKVSGSRVDLWLG